MATTRLRKTFAYPDSDSESSDLDEEHQEALLDSLRDQDDARSQLYLRVYLVVPIIAALYYLFAMFTSSTARQTLISVLSLSSLLCTISILYFIPIGAAIGKGKKPLYLVEVEKSPMEKYLPALNAALSGLLCLSALASWRRGAIEDALREAGPAVVLGFTMLFRQQLRPLDLEGLKQARYELKGA
ncbi:hypothetical protein B0A48_11084 [Cryoendolithus antarcticus]|uniref:Uncharacterized protein n=1 Tax=Cryoendolithus antarcticus TaxID=1507870 RepID=A0A1V8SUT8_9PEZI|nr:hypothetical protein B0A48_11084 [Cryoendolithus antarcticus]